MRQLVSLEEALELLNQHIQPMGVEQEELVNSLNRILAEDILAPIDLPPFDRSPLDGYAIRAEDTLTASVGNPVSLKVVREISAGKFCDQQVNSGQAVKILTGAPIPPGANEIIRFEDIELSGDVIKINRPVTAYTNYCFAGEDVQQGKQLLQRGNKIGPAHMGTLASVGINNVSVYKKPTIALLSTGNELVDVNQALSPGKIFNSNLYTFSSFINEQGAQSICLGVADDSIIQVGAAINQGLQIADMVVTTGGASVGEYDLMRPALTAIGAEILFWRVNIRPGTPILVAIKDNKLIICLSGNPGAAFITYNLLVRPILNKLLGYSEWRLPTTMARFDDSFEKSSKQRRFLRGKIDYSGGEVKVNLTGGQKPGVILSAVDCNVLLDVPAGTPPLSKGQQVQVVLINRNV